jgi:hypothetical protein
VQLKDLKANSIEEEGRKTVVFAKEAEQTYHNDIYPVTEGQIYISKYTKQAYKTSFNRFLKHINIQDLQTLVDLGPKVMEQIVGM